MSTTTLISADRPSGFSFSLRRLARLGFWFFLVKGLLWLAAPLAAWHVVG